MTTLLDSDLHVTRLTPTIGASVGGIDLAARHAESTITHLRALLVEHKVLFFGDQVLDPDSQIAFGLRFGELTASHPVVKPLDDDHPQVWEIDSAKEVRNDQWHTDVTFVERPPAASILRAVRVPEVGGDTLWADLERAYESLTPSLQRVADELSAEHDGSREFAELLAVHQQGAVWDGRVYDRLTPVVHPVVRVHPESGRRSLFVNPGFTTRILGVSEAESKYLLEIFYAHITKPEHQVRHQWRAGDVAFWDNRSTVHYASYDYPGFRRVMHRVTVRGDVPFGPARR